MRLGLLSVNFLLIYGLFSILARNIAPGLSRTRNPYTFKAPNEKTGKSYLAYCLELAPSSLSCAHASSITNHTAYKASKVSPARAHDSVCLRAQSHFSCQSVLSFFPSLQPARPVREGEYWLVTKLTDTEKGRRRKEERRREGRAGINKLELRCRPRPGSELIVSRVADKAKTLKKSKCSTSPSSSSSSSNYSRPDVCSFALGVLFCVCRPSPDKSSVIVREVYACPSPSCASTPDLQQHLGTAFPPTRPNFCCEESSRHLGLAATPARGVNPLVARNHPTLEAPSAGVPGRSLCLLMSRKTTGGDTALDELVTSLDRSRKRHLDVGLLRGDQVLDRLATQEASASPILKRTRTDPQKTPPGVSNMALTMAEFTEYMDKNTNKRISELDNKVGGMQTSIDKLDASVKDNSTKLDAHEARIARIEGQVATVRDGQFPPLAGTSRPFAEPPESSSSPPPSDAEFALARRSLRLWPIQGQTRDELWHSAGLFLGNNLGLEGRIDKNSVESITRVEIPSGPGVSQEALVRFSDVALRDIVMGAASKLAPFLDQNGRATAGMRMEVPPRLQQSFRVLFKYGQSLRARHGPGTRRHVKFSDVDKSLFLNVKLPGDEQWSKVSLEVARRGIRARETIDDGQLERRLDITGPLRETQRPRAASTAGPPPPTQASAWTRRSGGSSSS